MEFDYMSTVAGAIDAMSSGDRVTTNTFRNNLSNITNDLGSIFYLKNEARSEFRNIYESIIDSTIASMY